MLTGLSAFPLTPMNERGLREDEFMTLVEHLAAARVSSIGVLGSTGSYMYLGRDERARILHLAVQAAGDIPVVAGIGALRTREVLALAEDAQKAGARGLLLAPVSYQPLTDDEVLGLYTTVAGAVSLPLCVYDNPGTTHFTFSDELLGRIAALPQVASIKIPPMTADSAHERLTRLRAMLPSNVTIGISGDPAAATGMIAGCDGWYSVLGGLLPEPALAITRAVQAGDNAAAHRLSAELEPLWALYRQHGSLRVIATLAELAGCVSKPSLPQPLASLEGAAREHLADVASKLGFSGQ